MAAVSVSVELVEICRDERNKAVVNLHGEEANIA